MRATVTALSALTIGLGALAAPPAGAAPDEPTPAPWLELRDGAPTAQLDPSEAITSTVYVPTEVDSDGDGRRDRVRITVIRPRETQTRGHRVPVVFEHSPYRGSPGDAPNHDVDVDSLPQQSTRRDPAGDARRALAARTRAASSALSDYWVARGYAVVLGESIGSAGSDGCPTVGDAAETLSTRAVVDWLAGRTGAQDASGRRVAASWSTGNVGMTGVSYNGTLPNMVATTGVEGLRTIVPIAAISSWYGYYRSAGLVRAPHSQTGAKGTSSFQGEDLDVLARFDAGPERVQRCRRVFDRLEREQDRRTGDANAAWQARDYRPKADRVRASVLAVHGLEDYNVTTEQVATWWEGLGRAGVPRKLFLHKGGHGIPVDSGEYRRLVERWMARWLWGVRNDVEGGPQAYVQRPSGRYDTYASWPVPGAREQVLHLGASSASAPGSLGTTDPQGTQAAQSFTDAGRERILDDLVAGPDRADRGRLVYRSAPLRSSVQLSGTPTVALRASVDDRDAANLTVALVEYGPEGSSRAPKIVTRGWMDVQNREGAERTTPVEQGERYAFRFPLLPDDHVFAAGSRIGVVVASTDQQFTLRPRPGTRLTVDPGESSVTLPVKGSLGAGRR